MDNLIRASVCDTIRSDEVQHLIDDGVLKEVSDVFKMQKDSAIILPHICNTRCKKRVASNGNAADVQCRKTNNLKMIPDNTKHCYIKLPNGHTPECINKLIQIGIVEPIHIVEVVRTGEYKSEYKFMFPTRHIPPNQSST